MIKFTKDMFKDSIDWVSIVPDCVSIFQLMNQLEEFDIIYTRKRQFDNDYIVIDKSEFKKFFDCFDSADLNARITRLDLKFDFAESYKSLYDRVKHNIFPSSSIADSEGNINTCYFGSRDSGLFSRFYNKTLESHLDCDISRLEYEIKGSIALQFSVRWKEINFLDASNYLSKWLTEFNSVNGLDSIIGFFDFDKVEPYDFYFYEKQSIEHRLHHFVRQYGRSIKEYVTYLGGFDKLYDLCFDKSFIKDGVLNVEGNS